MTAPEGWYPDPGGTPGLQRRWDGEQWTDQVVQGGRPAWAHQPAAPAGAYRPSRLLDRAAIAVVLVVVALQAALVLTVDTSFERARQAALAGDDLDALWTTYDAVQIGFVPALLVAWILNAAWLSRARANAEVLAPDVPHKRGRGWTWGAWVCPVVNLWFPFQVVRDVSRATFRGNRPIVGWWWAAFLGMSLMNRVSAAVTGAVQESEDASWESVVSTTRTMEAASLVVTALAAVAWIAVLTGIERRQAAVARARAV